MTWLSDDDIKRFAVDGYLVVAGVVPERLLELADQEVDELIAQVAPHEGTGGCGQNSWFMPRRRLPHCEAALCDSPALSVAEELVSPNRVDFAFDHVQLATTIAPWSHVPGGPHIDGHGPGQDPPASFTMLAGILLSDQQTPRSGNLWVWPGSHLDHQRLFRERGTRSLQTNGGHSTLLDPPLELAAAAAVPLLGRRGDLVLAHFLLGHNKGGNTARHERRTVYYRLAVPGHPQRWEATFLDAWAEYPRMRGSTDDGSSQLVMRACG